MSNLKSPRWKKEEVSLLENILDQYDPEDIPFPYFKKFPQRTPAAIIQKAKRLEFIRQQKEKLLEMPRETKIKLWGYYLEDKPLGAIAEELDLDLAQVQAGVEAALKNMSDKFIKKYGLERDKLSPYQVKACIKFETSKQTQFDKAAFKQALR